MHDFWTAAYALRWHILIGAVVITYMVRAVR